MQTTLHGSTLSTNAPPTHRSLLARYLRPYWGKAAILAFLLMSTIGLQLLTPQIVRRFIDSAQAGQPLSMLLNLALLFLGAALFKYLLTLALTYLSEDVGWRTTNRLRADLAAHCLRLDLPFHHRHPPGMLIERIDGDVGQLARFFSQLVIQLLGNGLLLLGILIVLAGEDWRLGVGFLLFLAGALWILFRLRNFATPYLQAERAASADLFGFLEERLGGLEDIRANGAVAYTVQRLFGQMCALWRRSMAAQPRNAIFGSIIAIWFETGTVLALALGTLLFLRDALTIGTVYLLYTYLRMGSGPLLQLTGEIQHLQAATAAIARIGELFAETRTVVDGKDMALRAGPLTVTFDHVYFGYAAAAEDAGEEQAEAAGEQRGGVNRPPTVENFSLTIPAGRTLGLLGRTGSGKTTITRLLLRFYDPQAGAIRLGDIDLRDLTLSTLRRHVGIVTQEVQLFDASIRDNLTFFDTHVSDDAVVQALQAVGLYEWLRGLPDGLNTPLRAGGGLSAGEAQLLAFTRVLLKDPGVVILDEAAARLDPVTEERLDGAIGALLHGRTAIVIAHRLATVQKVDDILILADGAIQEYGPRTHLAADPTSRFAQLLQRGLPESEERQ